MCKKVGEWMRTGRKFYAIFFLSLLILSFMPFSVLAATPPRQNQVVGQQGLFNINYQAVQDGLKNFFNFMGGSWLRSNADTRTGFLRFMYFILVFAILFAGASALPFMSRNIRIVIPLVIALSVALLSPPELLNSIFGSFIVIFGFLFMFALIVLIFFAAFVIPATPRWMILLRIFLLILILIISQSTISYINAGFSP